MKVTLRLGATAVDDAGLTARNAHKTAIESN